MNTQNLGPYLAIVAVVAVLAFAGNLAIIASPAQPAQVTVVPQPTPTIVVIVNAGTGTSIEDQLANLRNQVSGELPSFDEFRAALPENAPEVDALPATSTGPTGQPTSSLAVQRKSPDGHSVSYIVSTDSLGQRWIGVPGGWLSCSINHPTSEGQLAIWNNLPDWVQMQVGEVCIS